MKKQNKIKIKLNKFKNYFKGECLMKYSKAKIEECASWVITHGLQDYGGATLKDFCKAMDIEDETYYQWMLKSEFSEAILKAKQIFRETQEERLVESLMQSALGYEASETKTEYMSDEHGNRRPKKQTVTKKNVAPNTGAAIFLLTNIAPEKWKNKLNTEHSGVVDTGLKINVRSEEVKELVKQAINK